MTNADEQLAGTVQRDSIVTHTTRKRLLQRVEKCPIDFQRDCTSEHLHLQRQSADVQTPLNHSLQSPKRARAHLDTDAAAKVRKWIQRDAIFDRQPQVSQFKLQSLLISNLENARHATGAVSFVHVFGRSFEENVAREHRLFDNRLAVAIQAISSQNWKKMADAPCTEDFGERFFLPTACQ